MAHTNNMKNNFLSKIYTKSKFQEKRLKKYLLLKDDIFFEELNFYVNAYDDYLIKNNLSIDYAVDSYISLCNEFLKDQIKFQKTGQYPTQDSSVVNDLVYMNKDKMLPYMIGLAISIFLWETHNKIYEFFKSFLHDNKDQLNSYLEIGPGHGLFLNQSIKILRNIDTFNVVDISPISINISKSIIEMLQPATKCNFMLKNIFDFKTDTKYDFIVMGEVLEHVDNPKELLQKISLYVNKYIFITTCVHCPAVDHLYHFKSIDEIEEMIIDSGFKIVDKLILPVEDKPMVDIVKEKTTINYCAVLKSIA